MTPNERAAEFDHPAMLRLADLLDLCGVEDDVPVTWGDLRRKVRDAAEGGRGEGQRVERPPWWREGAVVPDGGALLADLDYPSGATNGD